MNLQQIVFAQGKADALALRNEAINLTPTEIIARQQSIPHYNPNKDYSSWPLGAPVEHNGQIYVLINQTNAVPGQASSVWMICHTTNPQDAKPWAEPIGTSGRYMINECYKDENGKIWRSLVDNNIYNAEEMSSSWEEVTV